MKAATRANYFYGATLERDGISLRDAYMLFPSGNTRLSCSLTMADVLVYGRGQRY